jgi:hypothetical protein
MVATIALVLLLAQSPATSITQDNDRKSIPEPKERQVASAYDFVTATFFEPIAHMIDLPRDFRKILRRPRQAENTTALDEVPDSTWFTNRNFWEKMTLQGIRQGPAQPADAPDSGPWTIIKCKSDGVTPGFQIRDRKGDAYLLKFDPPGYLELSTAADVIGSRFLYAAGYNVPENFIVAFDERILVPGKDLQCSLSGREKIPLTSDALPHFLENLPRTPAGQLRAVASRFIHGKLKGPFSYQGVRADDPNDRVPHEHRRELRGLRMVDAFLNNTDTKQLNTLDSYVEENGRKFLQHYLIDFGEAFGSGSLRPKEAGDGHEHLFDPIEVMKSVFTLGLYHRADTNATEVHYPSIGLIEGNTFDPMAWKSNSPNPAFDNMTALDGYWAAKIVAAFTDDQIAAAVHAGEYSDPAAEGMLVEILKQRRDRIAGYWFGRVCPLDRFRLTPRGLVFDDLAIDAGLNLAKSVTYHVTVGSAHTVAYFKVRPGQPIPIDAGPERLEIQITRISPGLPALNVSVTADRTGGTPEITRIRR